MCEHCLGEKKYLKSVAEGFNPDSSEILPGVQVVKALTNGLDMRKGQYGLLNRVEAMFMWKSLPPVKPSGNGVNEWKMYWKNYDKFKVEFMAGLNHIEYASALEYLCREDGWDPMNERLFDYVLAKLVKFFSGVKDN